MYNWETRKNYEKRLPCGCLVHTPNGTKRFVIKNMTCKIKHKNVKHSKWIKSIRIEYPSGNKEKPKLDPEFVWGKSPISDYLQKIR